MKRFFLFLLLCFIVFAAPGCAAENEMMNGKTADKLSIVTTNFPGYDFARAIAGDQADIKMLLAPGEETHSFDPTPADIIAVENCDVFIYVGGESDQWVRDILDSTDTEHRKTISMMDCVEVYEEDAKEGMMTERGHHHEEEHHHDGDAEEEYDEHVWTSVVNSMTIVSGISSELCAADPEYRDVYEKNTEAYLERLQALDQDIRDTIAHADTHMLLFGDRFPFLYFVREYGLDYYAAFPGCASETEPNASTIAFLIDKGRSEHTSVVCKEAMSNGNIAKAIAEECGAKVEPLYACDNIPADDFIHGETYISLMRRNLDVLKEALYR